MGPTSPRTPATHDRGVAISISGIDGSGKTTLAHELTRVLAGLDVPVRYLHVYQWHRNLLTTPVIIVVNRFFGRRVLVFDRTIYDNIAVLAIRRYCPHIFVMGILRLASRWYPRFDLRFYLHTTFPETCRRRPDTDACRYEMLRHIYDVISKRVSAVRLESDRRLFDAVLAEISRSGARAAA